MDQILIIVAVTLLVAAFVIVLYEPREHKSTPISFKPQGFRDVYWCHLTDEPEIMGAANGKPKCPGCRTKWNDIAELEADEMHVFMFHINKYLDWIDRLHP